MSKDLLVGLLWFFAIAFILFILVGSCIVDDDGGFGRGRGYYGDDYWGGGIDFK